MFVKKKDLLKALQVLPVQKSATPPVLGNVKVIASRGRLTLIAIHPLFNYVKNVIETECFEEWETNVNYTNFFKIAKNSKELIELEYNYGLVIDKQITLNEGVNFPEIVEVEADSKPIDVKSFVEGITHGLVTAGEPFPFIKFGKKVQATNRLTISEYKRELPEMLLSHEVAMYLKKVIKDSVSVAMGDSYLLFRVGNIDICTKKLLSKFPNYEGYLPEEPVCTVRLDRLEFLQTIAKVLTINDVCRLTIGETVNFTTRNNQGETNITLDGEIEGKQTSLLVSLELLDNVIRKISKPEVYLEITTNGQLKYIQIYTEDFVYYQAENLR